MKKKISIFLVMTVVFMQISYANVVNFGSYSKSQIPQNGNHNLKQQENVLAAVGVVVLGVVYVAVFAVGLTDGWDAAKNGDEQLTPLNIAPENPKDFSGYDPK